MPIETIKNVLNVPTAFEILQSLVGAPRCQRIFLESYVRPQSGERVLDIGCGTGAAVYHLPLGIEYIGVDISAAYIDRATAKHGHAGSFFVADVTSSFEPNGLFDRAFSFGVLHHISDDGVRALLNRIRKLVKPGGIYATIDPCFVPKQRWIARKLALNDRGAHVRTVDEMQTLLGRAGALEVTTRADMLNLPFDFVVCVLTI